MALTFFKVFLICIVVGFALVLLSAHFLNENGWFATESYSAGFPGDFVFFSNTWSGEFSNYEEARNYTISHMNGLFYKTIEFLKPRSSPELTIKTISLRTFFFDVVFVAIFFFAVYCALFVIFKFLISASKRLVTKFDLDRNTKNNE